MEAELYLHAHNRPTARQLAHVTERHAHNWERFMVLFSNYCNGARQCYTSLLEAYMFGIFMNVHMERAAVKGRWGVVQT